MVAFVLDDFVCELTPKENRDTFSDNVRGRLVPQPCELRLTRAA